MSSIQIVAHRGASAQAPENTLRALEEAWACGAPWCEVDVQRTSDGVLVLVHDDTWERTAGLAQAVRETPWERVRALDVGSWFDDACAGERVPRLQDVLAWNDRLHLNLEIKSPQNDAGLAAAVAGAVRESGAAARTVLSCFDAAVIAALARTEPGLRLAHLGHAALDRDARVVDWQILDAASILAHPEWRQGRGPLVGQRLWAWTVDDPDEAERLVRGGVEGLITNDPARLVRHFGGA